MSVIREFAPSIPLLFADADLLSRAIENLVAYAVKYGDPGTVIRIRTRISGNHLLIEVEDQGSGIAPADLERIFEKFYRAARPENADVPGTGLGLPMVREIAELHGGTISAKSEPGVGSVFTLALPADHM
jgi:signal transduction histidine kinase